MPGPHVPKCHLSLSFWGVTPSGLCCCWLLLAPKNVLCAFLPHSEFSDITHFALQCLLQNLLLGGPIALGLASLVISLVLGGHKRFTDMVLSNSPSTSTCISSPALPTRLLHPQPATEQKCGRWKPEPKLCRGERISVAPAAVTELQHRSFSLLSVHLILYHPLTKAGARSKDNLASPLPLAS